jgi:hypothetical protein
VIRHIGILSLFAAVLYPSLAYAKRTAAPKVAPIVYDGQYVTMIVGGTNYPPSTNFVVEAGVVVEAKRMPTLAQILVAPSPSSQELTAFGGTFAQGEVVVGPAVIHMEPCCGVGVFTIRIIHQADLLTPSNAVIIPADAKGPVNILMESSTNLVDWVGALPGTYGTSSQQRYFRVRAVQQ